MQETEATMITSRRSSRERVAEWRSLSISSLMEESFSMIGVGRGDVGLGLVVVVVADEVLHRVLREELLELAVELGRQGLVGGDDQGRAVQLLR